MKFNTFQSLFLTTTFRLQRSVQSLWISATRSIHVYLLSSCYFAFIWFQFKFWNCIRHVTHTKQRVHHILEIEYIYILCIDLCDVYLNTVTKHNNRHTVNVLVLLEWCRCDALSYRIQMFLSTMRIFSASIDLCKGYMCSIDWPRMKEQLQRLTCKCYSKKVDSMEVYVLG